MSFDTTARRRHAFTRTGARILGSIIALSVFAYVLAFSIQPAITYLSLHHRLLLRGYAVQRTVAEYLTITDWRGGEYEIWAQYYGEPDFGVAVVPKRKLCPRGPGWSPDRPYLVISRDGRRILEHRVVGGERWKRWNPATFKHADLAPTPCPWPDAPLE